jgi:CMP/dCMP kinase
MKKGIIITIDGPSGAGKGTVAQAVAKRLGFLYMDTGAMYRAIALLAHRNLINLNDEKELTELILGVHISLKTNSDYNLRVFLGEEDVTEKIRTPEISRLSSDIGTKKVVRNFLKAMQRRIGRNGKVVAEGRDMGTYVFPNADFKFYIDASLDERAKRRWLQLKESGIKVNIEEVKEEIERRDRQDRERKESPLHPASDAVIIDTTNLTVDEAVEKIIKTVEEARINK